MQRRGNNLIAVECFAAATASGCLNAAGFHKCGVHFKISSMAAIGLGWCHAPRLRGRARRMWSRRSCYMAPPFRRGPSLRRVFIDLGPRSYFLRYRHMAYSIASDSGPDREHSSVSHARRCATQWRGWRDLFTQITHYGRATVDADIPTFGDLYQRRHALPEIQVMCVSLSV